MGQVNKHAAVVHANVYYADDDTDDIEVFEEAVNALKAEGKAEIVLNTFTGGDALLEYLFNTKPESGIIFLDINMPLKNGFEVLEEIKESEALSGMNVIMYSTSSDSKTIAKSREKGASLYVIKPFDFNELEATIKKVVSIDWDSFNPGKYGFVIGENRQF